MSVGARSFVNPPRRHQAQAQAPSTKHQAQAAMKIAFFSAHSYDIESLKQVGEQVSLTPEHEFEYVHACILNRVD